MAQPMMHLLIADNIYGEKPGSFRSYGDFLLGSIAPDAVHMRADCTKEMKRISHYRFTSENPISHFDGFFDEYHTPENRDFVIGYLVHLLSDMIWYPSVRVPFKESFSQAPDPDMPMNEVYYADCGQIQERLFWDGNAPRIIDGIREGKAYSLEGMIDAGSVSAWRDKLIRQYSGRRDIIPDTKYISERQVRDYMTGCTEECIRYLWREGART